jgi:hypothetical protein
MKVFIRGKGEVQLTQHHYVATGGQASVYVKNGTAFKVYTNKADMIPDGKMTLLSRIQDPNVIRPQDVLLDASSVPIGYTMQAVADKTVSMCQLFTRSFCERSGVTLSNKLMLTRQLQNHVSAVHKAGAVVVDLNELNILVSPDWEDGFLIDVDSYQVPGYPAPVLMPTIRDWSVSPSQFSTQSDWFSMAVLAFQLFIGVHPYRGTHKPSSSIPKEERLKHRMSNNISAFCSDVMLPGCCYPLDSIPEHYRQWLRAVLNDGKRLPPPDPTVANPTTVAIQTILVPLSNSTVSVTELLSISGTIIDYLEADGHKLVLIREHNEIRAELDGRRVGIFSVSARMLGGFGPKLCRPFVAVLASDGTLTCTQLDTGSIVYTGQADEIVRTDGRLYARNRNSILELEAADLGHLIITGRPVADVMPLASHLYEGCAIQSMLGSAFVSLFPRSRAGYQVKIPELDQYRIQDARFDRGVLMVIGAKNNRYDRIIFRFSEDLSAYDVRIVPDIQPGTVNFSVLDSGVCVALDEDERLELTSSKMNKTGGRVIADHGLSGDIRLIRASGQLGFIRNGMVCLATMTKP